MVRHVLKKDKKILRELNRYANFLYEKNNYARPCIVGNNYNKHKIMVIGLNANKGYLKNRTFKSYLDFKQAYLLSMNEHDFSRKVFRFLDVINYVLFGNKESILLTDVAKLKKLMNYVSFTNLIKTPTKPKTGKIKLNNLFQKIKYYNIYPIIYEINLLKPNLILVLGKRTMGIFQKAIPEIKKDQNKDYLFKYKEIPIINFHHPSWPCWSSNQNKLKNKNKLIKELLSGK